MSVFPPPYPVSDQALLLLCLRNAVRSGLVPAEQHASLKDLILLRRPALIAAAKAYKDNNDDRDLLDTLLLVAGLPPPPLITPTPAMSTKTIAAPTAVSSLQPSLFASTQSAPTPTMQKGATYTMLGTGTDQVGLFASVQETTIGHAMTFKMRSISALPDYENRSFEEIRASVPSPPSSSVYPTPNIPSSSFSLASSSTVVASPAVTNPFAAAHTSVHEKQLAREEAKRKAFLELAQQSASGSGLSLLTARPDLKVEVKFKNSVPTVSSFHIAVIGPSGAGKTAFISHLVDGSRPTSTPSLAKSSNFKARSLTMYTNVGVLHFELYDNESVPARALHGAIIVSDINNLNINALAALRKQLRSDCTVHVALTKADTSNEPRRAVAEVAAKLRPVLGVTPVSARTGLNIERPLLAIARSLCGFPLLTFEPQPAPAPERSDDAPTAPRFVW